MTLASNSEEQQLARAPVQENAKSCALTLCAGEGIRPEFLL